MQPKLNAVSLIKRFGFVSGAIVFFLIESIGARLQSCLQLKRPFKDPELNDSERVARYSERLLQQLGFSITVRLELTERSTLRAPSLIVSNHLGFWDVLVLSSLFSPRFVTSHEVRDSFFIGRLARYAGSIFVERRNRSTVERNVEEIRSRLDLGESVAIFPEATSTNGTSVLPFKRSLFQAAIASGRNVLPVCINYRAIDDAPVSIENRDELFYYGEHSFFIQLMRILKKRSIAVEVAVLDRISPTQEATPASIADHAHQLISKHFVPIS